MARRPPRDHVRDGIVPAFALDHLHTETPALAGHASKASDPQGHDAHGWFSRRRRGLRAPSPSRRLVAALLTAVLAGGIGLAGMLPAAAATDPNANTVLAFNGAPQLGPKTGLALNAGFIDIAVARGGRGYWAVASDGGVFSYGTARFYGSTGGMQLAAPVVGMAARPTGKGYWLVAFDGGIFSFGDAEFRGSMGGKHLNSPIVAMASTRSGRGYWMVALDGGVFSFGDARYYGSLGAAKLNSPIVAMAATRSGRGYYLLAADGGVFAFGDARFRGAAIDVDNPASGIAVANNGGYWVSRENGVVNGFAVPSSFGAMSANMSEHPTVAIAAAPRAGFWVAQSHRPRSVAPAHLDLSQHPFLRCTRAHESDSAGGYRAVSPGGLYRGAYQFLRTTWNNVARSSGRPDLVGVDPAAAAPWDQDFIALTLYRSAGAAPWGGRCAGL
jgi:hypothetical protein